MSAYGITNDYASITKTSKDTIVLKPKNNYLGVELDDDKLRRLYGTYCGLMLMQYYEEAGNDVTCEISEMEEVSDIKHLSLGLSLDQVIHDYKQVASSVVDDYSYQQCDTGILLSNLDDVINWLEELQSYKNTVDFE